MKTYPIYLTHLDERHCVVVGGGHEAQWKVASLLKADAIITVINPTLTDKLQSWADKGRFTWLNRNYQHGDLEGVFMVIAERGTDKRNAAIAEEARAEKALYNVMDNVDNCNFVAGSVIRRGPLTITISTSGAAPAYSVRLRERFQKEFGKEHGQFLEILQALRPPMEAAHRCFQQRRKLWYAVVDSDLIDLIRAEDEEAIEVRLTEIVGELAVSYWKRLIEIPHLPERWDGCEHGCRMPSDVVNCPVGSG